MREPELSYGLRLTNYRLERPVAAARNVFSDATRTAKERFNKVKLEFGDLQQLGSDERLALKIVEQRQELAQENAPEAIHGEARGVARALHAVLRKESDRRSGRCGPAECPHESDPGQNRTRRSMEQEYRRRDGRQSPCIAQSRSGHL